MNHICMISDDNYVMPTCVTIQSLIDSGINKEYTVHIIASELNKGACQQLKKLQTDKVKIEIINVNAEEKFAGFHHFAEESICAATIASLFKFLIPEIFSELDKIIYIDGDLIIKSDFDDLCEINIGDNYAGVVKDSGGLYWKHEYIKKVKHYFNSGVMLLNLKKLREDNVAEILCKTKKELNDASLMDQNVFNIVFDTKIYLLPIRYNFLAVNLNRANEKWKIKDVNKYFGTSYKTKRDLYDDAAIVHYSSKEKPWKNLDGPCSDLWIHAYLNAPIEHNLIRTNDCENGISVIMPCYNTAQYVEEALNSIVEQTYQNFEIICIDDGSTDNTLDILKDYADVHKEIDIKIFAHNNMRQGYERNFGIGKATKKYIYFMDSDDLLDKDCFQKIYSSMEENDLDLLFFEGTSFYESNVLEEKYPQYKFAYNRKDAYPEVYEGQDLYVSLREHGDLIISPCLQLVNRKFLIANNLKFPEILSQEDNIYLFDVLLSAKRVKCITDILFKRRVRNNSTMTKQNYNEQIYALTTIIDQMLLRLNLYEENKLLYNAIINHILRFLMNLDKLYMKLNDDERKLLKENCTETQNFIIILMQLIKRNMMEIDGKNIRIKELEEDNSNLLKRLKYAYKVKDNLLVELALAKDKNLILSNSHTILDKTIDYYKKYGLLKTVKKIKEKLLE